jgi:hypothetical protein
MPNVIKHAGPVLIAGALAASVVVASLTTDENATPAAKPVAAEHSTANGRQRDQGQDAGAQDTEPSGRQRAMEAKARQQRWAQDRRAKRAEQARAKEQP